jgi:flavin-dependent dehydrogenase
LPALNADYLVAGAGPAGLTAARLLALKGRKVLVVDPERQVEKRLELLAPASLATVAALGLSPLLEDPVIARPCLGIRRRWDSADVDHEDFLRHPWRTGYVVDRTAFDARLRAAAITAGVAFCAGRIAQVRHDRGEVLIRANDQTLPRASFSHALIDATGRAATVARRMGARVTARDRMVAELTEETVEHGNPDTPGWLDVRRAAPGWCYRIEGPGGKLQSWTIRRTGSAGNRSRAVRVVDASSGILSEAAGERWIAIGDAAISFDPIASQGLYNALSSALVATGALMSDMAAPIRARLYSDAVAATFEASEAGRSRMAEFQDVVAPATLRVSPARAVR